MNLNFSTANAKLTCLFLNSSRSSDSNQSSSSSDLNRSSLLLFSTNFSTKRNYSSTGATPIEANLIKVQPSVNNTHLVSVSDDSVFFPPSIAAKVKLNSLNLKNHAIPSATTIKATTTIQANWRRHWQTRPENISNTHRAAFRALRDSEQAIVGYKINGKLVKLPKLLTDKNDFEMNAQGTYKILTHRDAASVGLTLREDALQRNFNEIDPQSLKLIQEQNLTYLVPQYRVNASLLLAKNLEADLFEVLINTVYEQQAIPFKVTGFLGLAKNLDICHSHQITHGDLKPENLFLVGGELYASDLDSMGAGMRHGGTEFYSHVKLRGHYDSESRIKKDKYAVLATLMVSAGYDFIYPIDISLCSSKSEQKQAKIHISHFITNNVKDEFQQLLYQFLINPAKFQIDNLETIIQTWFNEDLKSCQ